ncbi:uncharacterized protein [Chironomus tepperi]|uniref:uncharacterized protein n=1 Tax=Chironomus tepperi TaxID=113505 RepID=UPI00391F329C
MSNLLVEVPIESLPKLRDAYKINWPEHILAFNFLAKMIKRFEKDPKQREIVRIYCVDGKLEKDATFIGVVDDYNVLVGTLDMTFKQLSKGFKGLNYNTVKKLSSLKEIYRETALEFIKAEGLKTMVDKEMIMAYMSCEDAKNLEFEVPVGLELRGLTDSDIEKINSVWPNRYTGSEDFLSYCISQNFSIGLYDQSSGELVAWCLENDVNSLFVLQVDDNHLRKGYASIVVKALSKLIAEERGLDINANIMCSNVKSTELFKKLSFKVIDKNSIFIVRN